MDTSDDSTRAFILLYCKSLQLVEQVGRAIAANSYLQREAVHRCKPYIYSRDAPAKLPVGDRFRDCHSLPLLNVLSFSVVAVDTVVASFLRQLL